MFPDPSLICRPYPSLLDGIKSPQLENFGYGNGGLHLIAFSAHNEGPAYGIQISCDAYFAVEEMLYSIAQHGDADIIYDGTVYVKEAVRSKLLDNVVAIHPSEPVWRHFIFVSYDYCFETLGKSEPAFRMFPDIGEAYEWKPTFTDV